MHAKAGLRALRLFHRWFSLAADLIHDSGHTCGGAQPAAAPASHLLPAQLRASPPRHPAHRVKGGQGARVDKLQIVAQGDCAQGLALDGIQADHLGLLLTLQRVKAGGRAGEVGWAGGARLLPVARAQLATLRS